jgi:hypothetical protein
MILCVRHDVADFNSWKPVFDEQGHSRKQQGAVGHRVLRRADDSNSVMVLTKFPDRTKAEAYIADPLLSDTMGRAGVKGAPEVTFWEDAEEVVY